jgi:hypothetical protein
LQRTFSSHGFGGRKEDEKALVDPCHNRKMYLNENGGMIMTTKRGKFAAAVSLVEVMIALAILLVMVLTASRFRYYAVADVRKADVQITAARLASLFLYGWKGRGGYSGYGKYNLVGGDDPLDPNDYDIEYDYATYDPDDYEYDIEEPNSVTFSGLTIYDNAPGPAVPDGFAALDSGTSPNFHIVANNANYYATLSYRDQEGKPRLLDVCVAWMDDYQTWAGEPYRSVRLTTYAND